MPLPRLAPRAACLAGAFALSLAAPSALAQSADEGEGRPLDRFLEEEFTQEAREALSELFAAVGPLVQQFASMMDDIPRYEAPEILPNGDIIIRRKRDHSEEGPVAPGEDIET